MITKNRIKKYLQKSQLKSINNFCIFLLINPKILNDFKSKNFKCFKIKTNFFLDIANLQNLYGLLKGNAYLLSFPEGNIIREIEILLKKYKTRAIVYCVGGVFYTEKQISEINSRDIKIQSVSIFKFYYKFILLLKNKIHLLE